MAISNAAQYREEVREALPRSVRENLALALVLPGMFLFSAFMFLPLAYLVVLSLTDATLATIFGDSHWLIGDAEFIGVANYLALLADPQFWTSMRITWLYVATSVILKVILGISIAMVLTHDLVRGKRFMRALVILPMGLPAIFSITVWRGMFSSADYGLINQVLVIFGFEPVAWLAGRWTAFAAYNVTEMWLAYPFMVIITVSALQNVPDELHDAAKVDGASFLSRFRHVTLPTIKRPVMFASILTAAASFQQFLIPFVFNQGGPARANELIILYGYREAFNFREYGEGAAIMLTAVFFIGLFMLVAVVKGELAKGAHN